MSSTAADTINQELTLMQPWDNFPHDTAAIEQLEKKILLAYLRSCRWFAGKARKIAAVCVDTMLTITGGGKIFHLLIVKTKYRTGKLEQYLLPVSLITADHVTEINPKGIIAFTRINDA